MFNGHIKFKYSVSEPKGTEMPLVLYSFCEASVSVWNDLVFIQKETVPNPYFHILKELLQPVLRGAVGTQRCVQRHNAHQPMTSELGGLPSAPACVFSPPTALHPWFFANGEGKSSICSPLWQPTTVWAMLGNTKLLLSQRWPASH